jgi:hypothetical protein
MKNETKKHIVTGLLLTPLILSQSPVEIHLEEEFSYDHESQVNTLDNGQIAAYTMSSSTFNGTQTFDYRGNPTDSDSDSDADPFG